MRRWYLLVVRVWLLGVSNIQKVSVVEYLGDPLLLTGQTAMVLINHIFSRIDALHHLDAILSFRTIFLCKLVLLLLQDAVDRGLMVIDGKVYLRTCTATASPCAAAGNALVE